MKKTVKISAFFALVSTCVLAQEKDSLSINPLKEVVISDTKFTLKKEKSGKVIEVITADDLAKKSGQSLATVLSQVAGVEINGNQSANGKNLGYYIRGGKNRQVLIMIDGIPVTDASGINIEYDLRLLPVEQVERIEVMKGAASTLYGTGAATGVINITLKKSAKKEIQGNAYVNIGSNNTSENKKYNGQDFNQGISVNGEVKKVNYFAGFNSTETSGMSQIAEPVGTKYEEDRFSRQNAIAKLGFKATEKLTLDFFGNYDRIKNGYDFAFDNTGFNDTDVNETTSEQVRFGFSPKYKYNKGEFVLNSGFTKIKRDYNELNSWTNTTDYSLYESRSVILDGFNKYNFNNELALIVGANYQFHDMLSQTPFATIENEAAKFNILDGYTTLVYNSSFGLNVNAGVRLNTHSQYGNNVVYNINPSYNFKTSFPLKVLASYSTAFITPSLYQLYSEYGNSDLNPEENATVEAGFETELLNKKIKLSAVGFYRDQNDAIDFFYNPDTFEAYYVNVDGKSKAKGVETTVSVALTEKLSLNGNYTFTQVDKVLDRLIPKHKVNASIDFQPTKRTLLNLNYQYLDARNDAFYNGTTFTVDTIQLGSYQLLNALAKYELIQNRLTVFGTVTNIFNEEFVENAGYSTRGRNFRLGVNIVL
ncbi:MAG: TonB-dependent receptor plug domain-containing protein [Flavobacterium sp.]|jgi:vitamin B12 transporter|uniref:TonB-dependent receptor plug domain-containing protein n=1 Tax=Flavobacterium TaxID=237 RepID=UPI000DB461B5|nr:TonB-dependent receptor [Flavobacterium sp.]MCZ8090330.1 TonB-dependent receptor plug domain-containing protein [Flavobacterium sp.]MCZ8331922.1 TonB-dependent receptor plug domain-containing protein [Flavobacterium sp.]PZO30411.1 MAG: TonB-dependent receptor [Flavobacteriaceae bacterium]